MLKRSKPKKSTISKMSEGDITLVDHLVYLCGNYYYKTSSPSKPGPNTNPQELDDMKSKLLLLCMRVGERVWFPRGNPGNTTSLHAPRQKKRRTRV